MYKICLFSPFQQEQVLSELYWYTHQAVLPEDNASVLEALKYLEACHKLFEKGFLSHERITSADCEVLKNINEGYTYFKDWISSILEKGMYTTTA